MKMSVSSGCNWKVSGFHSRVRQSAAILTLLVLIAAAPAQVIWSGTGNLTLGVGDGANWVGGNTPTSGVDLSFGSPPATAQTVNIPSTFTIGNITFATGTPRPDYTISGSSKSVTLNGNIIVNTGGNVTLTNGISVILSSGAHTITVNAGPSVSVASPLGENESAAASIVKSGSGSLTLSGQNSYTGGTTINSGTLILNGGTTSLGSSTAPLTVSGGTLDLGALARTAGVVTVSGGTIQNGTLTGSSYAGQSGTVSAVLAGTGALTKSTSGTLVLTGTNTYTGGTTVSTGTLQLGNGGTTGSLSNSGGLSIATGATVSVNRSTDITLATAISGNGAIAKVGNNTLTLSGGNGNFTGTLTSTGNGTVALAGSNARGTGDWTFSGNSTLDLAIGGNSEVSLLRGTANTTFVDTAHLLAKNSYAISGGTQTFSGAAYLTASDANVITGGNQSFFTATNPLGSTPSFMTAFTALDDTTVGNLLKGTSRLVVDKVSADPTIVGGTQTFNGYASLQANHAGAVADGSIQVFNNNSHLRASRDDAVTGGYQAFYDTSFLWAKTTDGGNAITGGHQMFYDSSSLVAASANSVTGGDQTFHDTSGVYANATGAIGGVTLDLYDNSFISIGANATNALSSGTNIRFNNSSALDEAAPSGGDYKANVVASYGGTLSLNGVSTTVGVIASDGLGAGLIQNGSATVPATLTVNIGDVSMPTYSGIIQNGGAAALGLTKAGFGSFRLANTGPNSASYFTGDTAITGGTLVLGESLALSGSTLNYDNRGGNLSFGTLTAATLGGLSGGQSIGLYNDDDSWVALTIGANNQNSVYSGVISDQGSLVKTGSGYLYLTGSNVYSGGTTINGGFLVLGNHGTSGSITGNVTFTGNTALGGGELQFNRTDATTFGGSITGPGRVTNFGGDVTLDGTNTYSGDTFVAAGSLSESVKGSFSPNSVMRVNTGATLNVTNPSAIAGLDNYTTGAGGSVVIASGVTLTTNDTSSHIFSGIISGSGGLAKSGAGALTLAGPNTYSGGTTVGAGTLVIGADNNLGAAPGTATPASLTFNGGTLQTTASLALNSNRGISLGASGGTFSPDTLSTLAYGGIIAGTGALTKTGGGTLALSGSSTFAGGVAINAGQISVSSDASLGAFTGPLALNNGVLITTADMTLNSSRSVSLGTLGSGSGFSPATGTTLTVASPISGSGALTKYDNGTLTLTGSNTYTGDTTISVGILNLGGGGPTGAIAGNVIDNASLVFSRSNNSSYGGVISGTGSVTQAGTAVTTLTGANTYTGGTVLLAGSLAVSSDANLGAVPGAPMNNNLVFTGGTLETTATFPLNNFRGVNLGTGGGTFNTDSGTTLTYGGPIIGGADLTKAGSGTLVLSGASIYGGTVINAGTLQLAATGSLSPGSDVTVNGSGVFHLFGDQTIRALSSASPNSSVMVEAGATLTSNMPMSGIGSTSTFAGSITGAGSFIKTGGTGSVMTLTGSISLSGLTTIVGGTLQIGNGGTAGGILGNITINGGSTLDFNRSDANNYAAVLSGSGAIVKDGTGTLTLSGVANTFSGLVTINNGTLAIAGSNAGNNVGVTVGSLGVFDVQNNLTIGSLSGLGSATIAGGKTLTFANSGLLSTVISGTGNVSFLNTATIKAPETYTGSTSLPNAGTALILGDGATVGSVAGNISVVNSSNIFFNEPIASPVSYAGIISGGGSVSVSGGNVTLGGVNTYSGPTTINGGTLNLGVDSALPAGSVSVSSGATLNVLNNQTVSSLNSTGNVTVSSNKVLTIANGAGGFLPVISGAGGVTFNSPSTITGNELYTGPTTIKSGQLGIGNGGTTGAIAGDAVISLAAANTGGVVFNRSDAVTYSGIVSGNGNLVKNGSGTLTLMGSSSYTGQTNVNSGTLVIGTANALPTATTLFVASTGTLDVAGDQVINHFTGNATNSFSSLIKIESGKTLDVALGASVTTNGGSGTAFYGNITDGAIAGTGGIFRVGNDTDGRTVGLFGINTYTGGTIIDPLGKLLLGNNGLNGSVGTIVGNVADDGLLIFNYGTITTFAGVISGSGAVALGTLSGTTTGDVRLTGANTYTGGTTVASKTLIIGDGGTTGSIVGNVALVANAIKPSAIGFNRSDNISFPGVISGTGDLVKASTGSLTLTGANTFTGNTTVNSGPLIIGATNTLPANTQLSLLAGAVLDASNFNQTIAGFGPSSASSSILIGLSRTLTVAMPQANTFTSYPGDITGNGTFAATGTDVVVNLTGNLANSITTAPAAGVTLVVGSAPFTITSSLNFSGNTSNTLSNAISGTGSIIATSGSLTLTSPSTYTGGTTVSGGKLIVNNSSGSATGTGPVDVGSGALLGGSGFISGAVTLNAGSTLAPGNSPGTLTVGSLAFAPSATFAFDLNDATGTAGTNWDLVNITGGLTITATTASPFLISLTTLNGLSAGSAANFNATLAYQWKFLSAAGGITGFTSPAVFSINATGFLNAIGPNAFFSVSQSGNDLFLNFSPVPEPSTWALLATGLGAFGLIAIRRRKK